MDNKIDSGAERILFRLKTHGAQSTAALAGALRVSSEAVRQQVQKLLEAGWLEGEPEKPVGAGRPRQRWLLTAAGHGRFPDSHAQLAVELLGSVRELFGAAGIERMIASREASQREAYLSALASAGAMLEARLRTLASLREAEGYMARLERDGEDWLLIEDHCPICAAATACQGFCRAELSLFQAVLGDALEVRREAHLLSGGQRCSYRIRARSEVGAKKLPRRNDSSP